MPDLQLYTLVVPQDSQADLTARLEQQLESNGVIGQDGSVVSRISSEPDDETIRGLYRGRFAKKMAGELFELSQSSGFDPIPLAGIGETSKKDGYYSFESADVDQVQPQTASVQEFTLQLAKEGTRSSHWRAVRTNPHQIDHEFGTGLEGLIGVPSTARKARWMHPTTKETALATPIETRDAELGDVDVYDLTEAPWYDPVPFDEDPPTLIYDVDYLAEERLDCRVYDTLGHGTKLDAGRNLQWQKVFSTQHSTDDELVLDNGLIRLRLDDHAQTLEAQRWDPDGVTETEDTGTYGEDLYNDGLYAGSAGAWVDVGLEQPEDVELFDVDIREIGMAGDRVRLTFVVDGELFAMDARLQRGFEDVLFSRPENQSGPTPQSLEDWLAPIASETIVDPQPSKGLVRRSQVI